MTQITEIKIPDMGSVNIAVYSWGRVRSFDVDFHHLVRDISFDYENAMKIRDLFGKGIHRIVIADTEGVTWEVRRTQSGDWHSAFDQLRFGSEGKSFTLDQNTTRRIIKDGE